MTSLSRRKRRTTRPGTTPPVRTWASLALLVCAALAPAQSPAVRMVGGPIQQTRYQPSAAPGTAGTEPESIAIQLVPPGLDRLSQLDSDSNLMERIKQQTPNEKHEFPPSPILSRDTYAGRGGLWQKRQMTVEPNFVCYGKLQSMFEDKNTERYGWDLGPLSVPLEVTKFASDVALFPARAFSDPCRFHECSAGHCLPGDPVPFLLYPPEIATVTGTAAELAVIAALVVVFP